MKQQMVISVPGDLPGRQCVRIVAAGTEAFATALLADLAACAGGIYVAECVSDTRVDVWDTSCKPKRLAWSWQILDVPTGT